jgi:hypothetical protein
MQDLTHVQVQCLGQGERDVHLAGPGRIGQTAGQDAAVPESGRHRVARRREKIRGRGRRHRVTDDDGGLNRLRQTGGRRW